MLRIRANKELSIKEASDEELEELIRRLERENRLQELINMIQDRVQRDLPYSERERIGISTEKPIESLYHVDDGIDFLEHHGILGMKWGIRKFQRKDGTRTPAGKKQAEINREIGPSKKQQVKAAKQNYKDAKKGISEDAARVRDLKKKKASQLSNSEMKEVIDRQQLVTKYNELNPSKKTAGKKWLKERAKKLGTGLADDYLMGGSKYLIDNALATNGGIEVKRDKGWKKAKTSTNTNSSTTTTKKRTYKKGKGTGSKAYKRPPTIKY